MWVAALAPAAAGQEAAEALRPLAWDRAPALLDDAGGWGSLRTAIERSLAYYRRRPAEAELRFGPRTAPVRAVARALGELAALLARDPAPTAAEVERAVRARFELVESSAGSEVLFTGYYEPVIEASLTRQPGYEVPIYRLPPGGSSLTRAEIRGAAGLAGQGLELAWARSRVDAFFVEVQGSGSLRLPSGELRRFGYAGSNAHPYRSIGKLLIAEGKAAPGEMSMQWLRRYLAEASPGEVARVLEHNASFVFFRWLPGEPEGALGQPVTPGRSIATDLRLMPRGALAFLATTRPVRGADGEVTAAPLRRFVLNQDTGGAIRGPGRVDVFWGRGPEAAETAGLMQQRGRLLFLVPREGGQAGQGSESGG